MGSGVQTAKKPSSGGRSRWVMLLTISPLLISLSLLYLPNFWVHMFMLLDYYYDGFVLFNSPLAKSYHDFLMSRLPDLPEIPLPELPLNELSKEKLYEMSNGYTFPVVIRGMLAGSPALTTFNNRSWWKENYGNETVLCKYVDQLGTQGDAPECTIAMSFGDENGNGRLYVTGESKIFARRPELEAVLFDERLNNVAPGERVFTQLFLGYPGMGSDIHGAIGTNMFRQIAGRKKWWLMPQSETPYVRASINKNGFSSHTLTKIGKKNGEEPSSYLSKIKRYTVILNPGDVLLNPPWIWHGIKNLGEDENPDELNIGIPTRFNAKFMPAFRNNPILSAIAIRAITQQFGGVSAFTSNPGNLQNGIEHARKSRASEFQKSAEIAELEKKLADREKMEREM